MEREDVLDVYRHSLAHILAKAVIEIFGKENVQYAIGPEIDDGLYYDFVLPRTVTKDDFAEIEEKMHEIIKRRESWLRQEISRDDALEMFKKALGNIMPSLEVKAVRRGGSNYQVPMEVRPERRQTLGLRWLVNYARLRSERTMADRLYGEIMDACHSTGGAVKKKEDTLKMAEANKAFAHYRW